MPAPGSASTSVPRLDLRRADRRSDHRRRRACRPTCRDSRIVPATIDLMAFELRGRRAPRPRTIACATPRRAWSPATRRTATTYVLIDCPPSLNLLTVNALAAADAVLVPLQCEFFALEGLAQLLSTVEEIRVRLNPKLQIHGVVLTMYDQRTSLSDQVVDDVRRVLGEKVYDDHHPAQRAGGRIAVARQAGAALRLSLLRQPGLHPARLRGDRARAANARGVSYRQSDGKETAMAVGAQKARLGRGLASLIGERSTSAGDRPREERAAHRVPLAALKPGALQPAAELRRRRSSRSSPPRSASAGWCSRSWSAPSPRTTSLRDRRRRAALARGAARRSARGAGRRARLDDHEALEIAIIENVQREDLNADRGGARATSC